MMNPDNSTAFIVAKRNGRGEIIAYLQHADDAECLRFEYIEPIAALFFPDLEEAERLCGDWSDYWRSKGYPFTATVETITEGADQ